MTFNEKIQNAIGAKTGVYSLDGTLIEGMDLGFSFTEDMLIQTKISHIRCRNVIIAVENDLTPAECNLIRITFELFEDRGTSDFVRPLEYILKNDVDNENIRGKYIGSTVLYIKPAGNIKEIINDIYEGWSFETVEDGEGVYIVKQMEEVEQEAEALIGGISDEGGLEVIVGAGRTVSSSYTVKEAAVHAKTSAVLAQALNFKEGFYPIDKMIMYGMIHSIDRKKIDFYMKGGYSGFADVVRDRELIETAEELFRCHLNISEAARRLYLHRNTLLYRIEKIKNLTDIDIKKFEEAVIFRIIISIYKLKNI